MNIPFQISRFRLEVSDSPLDNLNMSFSLRPEFRGYVARQKNASEVIKDIHMLAYCAAASPLHPGLGKKGSTWIVEPGVAE
jgi:hypothetical protein